MKNEELKNKTPPVVEISLVMTLFRIQCHSFHDGYEQLLGILHTKTVEFHNSTVFVYEEFCGVVHINIMERVTLDAVPK